MTKKIFCIGFAACVLLLCVLFRLRQGHLSRL